MDKAVVVFIFPEPTDNVLMGEIIRRSKEIFKDMPDVKVHLAIKEAANEITSFIDTGITRAEKNGEK